MRLNVGIAEKILGDVGDGSRFFATNGKIFASLVDLKNGLREMSEEHFFHHVREGGNDFSNWIRECLGDVRLADSLIGLDKDKAVKKIASRIAYIERYLKNKK